jgi:hypothetical protein
MAKYLLLIYGDEQQWDALQGPQWEAHMAAHAAFRDAAGTRIGGGEQLESSGTATTLRSDGDGGVFATDGPFLETKEALGGFYLLEADDLDEAVRLTSMLPEVKAGHSGIEIRPVVERR